MWGHSCTVRYRSTTTFVPFTCFPFNFSCRCFCQRYCSFDTFLKLHLHRQMHRASKRLQCLNALCFIRKNVACKNLTPQYVNLLAIIRAPTVHTDKTRKYNQLKSRSNIRASVFTQQSMQMLVAFLYNWMHTFSFFLFSSFYSSLFLRVNALFLTTRHSL